MSRAKSERGNEFVTIASKVAKEDKARVKAIADAFGMTFYELLQSLLLALLRYFDSDSLITYDHNCMMSALANTMYGLKGSYSPLQKRDRDNRKIRSAILFVEDSPKRRPQSLFICRDRNGQMVESLNFDKMVSEFLKCNDPDILSRLEDKKKELGFFSISHTLHEIIMQRTRESETIKAEIGEMFDDIRIPSGNAINEDIRYKRGYRKNVDEYTTIVPNQTFRADL